LLSSPPRAGGFAARHALEPFAARGAWTVSRAASNESGPLARSVVSLDALRTLAAEFTRAADYESDKGYCNTAGTKFPTFDLFLQNLLQRAKQLAASDEKAWAALNSAALEAGRYQSLLIPERARLLVRHKPRAYCASADPRCLRCLRQAHCADLLHAAHSSPVPLGELPPLPVAVDVAPAAPSVRVEPLAAADRAAPLPPRPLTPTPPPQVRPPVVLRSWKTASVTSPVQLAPPSSPSVAPRAQAERATALKGAAVPLVASISAIASDALVFTFDLETTGLDSSRHSITEIGLVHCHSNEKWVTLVNPGRAALTEKMYPLKVRDLTGITAAMVSEPNVPGFVLAAEWLEEEVRKHCGGVVAPVLLVAHNARDFDVRFLVAEYMRSKREMPSNWRFVDTMDLVKKHLPKAATGIEDYKLGTLARFFKVSDVGAHRALADAAMLSGVLEKLRERSGFPKSLTSYSFPPVIGKVTRSSPAPLFAAASLPLPPRRMPVPEAVPLLYDAPEELEAELEEDTGADEEESEEGLVRRATAKAPTPRPKPRPLPAAAPPTLRLSQVAADPLLKAELAFLEGGDAPVLDLADDKPAEWDRQLVDFLPVQPDRRNVKLAQKLFGTFEKLLRHYPTRFEQYQTWHPDLPPKSKAIATGTVLSVIEKGSDLTTLLIVKLETPQGVCTVNIWRRGVRSALGTRRALKVGSTHTMRGAVSNKGLDADVTKEAPAPAAGSAAAQAEEEEEEEELASSIEILPQWPKLKNEMEGDLSNKRWRAMLETGLSATQQAQQARGDWLQAALTVKEQAELGLIGGAEALRWLHTPVSQELVIQARKRIAFEELLLLQLAVLRRRAALLSSAPAPPCGHVDLMESAIKDLRFALTAAQQSVLYEILGDMAKPEPMLRLLAGDVGCGKSVVAFLALLAAHGSGTAQEPMQAVLMAPTTVLAQQHYGKFKELVDKLAPGERPVVRLFNSDSPDRKDVLKGLAEGKVNIAIGTVALIQPGVKFSRLGLVVVDEEQRFGVSQRESLRRANADGTVPHVLSMSATPIPRSLALSAYGDHALSLIDAKPPGRGAPVATEARAYDDTGDARKTVLASVRAEVAAGGQAYLVYPNVEASKAQPSVFAAVPAHAELCAPGGALHGLSVGLLHGAMSEGDKAAAIDKFSRGETRVLVATKVVEVGVDVQAATLLVVESAERFGLAQLHQLRGRVGRGTKPGRCFLLFNKSDVDNKGEESNAAKRMAILRRLSDGLEIAEEDMKLRGTGQLLVDMEQSGRLDCLSLASLVDDAELLDRARLVAARLLKHSSPKELHPALRYALRSRDLWQEKEAEQASKT